MKVEPGSKKNRSPGPQSFNPMPGVSYFISKMFKSTELLQDNMKKLENKLTSLVFRLYFATVSLIAGCYGGGRTNTDGR